MKILGLVALVVFVLWLVWVIAESVMYIRRERGKQ